MMGSHGLLVASNHISASLIRGRYGDGLVDEVPGQGQVLLPPGRQYELVLGVEGLVEVDDPARSEPYMRPAGETSPVVSNQIHAAARRCTSGSSLAGGCSGRVKVVGT